MKPSFKGVNLNENICILTKVLHQMQQSLGVIDQHKFVYFFHLNIEHYTAPNEMVGSEPL